MPKEVVTLSFGSYASFVSAHYWNLQDEAAGYSGREDWSEYAAGADYSVLFSEAEGAHGVSTYRPRAVCFDIAGSSGGVSFSPDGAALPPLAAASVPVPTWLGGCEVHRSAPVARSAFLERLEEHEGLDWDGMGADEAARQQAALEAAAHQLDAGRGGSAGGGGGGRGGDGALHWTDFCKVFFNPRSICALPGVWSSPYEHSLAAGWGEGAELLGASGGGFGGGGSGGAVVEDALDRIRYLGEACDSLAGFQVLADDLTGFGALAAAVLAEVVEEYTGRPLVLFSLRRPGQWEQQDGAPGGAVSTAWATMRARDELSAALAVTHTRELASLYVPLAAPSDRAALPYLSYNAALPFHSSAILASAVDTALLPARLTGASSPLGPPLGASDFHSLVRLMRPGGGGSANLAALHLALPCPSLPADTQQLQQQLDERVRPPHGGAAASGGGEAAVAASGQALYGSTAQFTLAGLASLTPGISGRDDDDGGRGASRAESYCLRGGRTDAGPASTSAALSALDMLLLRQPHRMCVRHRCTTPMPLAVPLPFPHIFARGVSVSGDVAATHHGGGAGGGSTPAVHGGRVAGHGVHCVPVLTRIQATTEFEGWVRGIHDRWSRAAAGVAGRTVLDAWGLGRDDAGEVAVQLQEMAASFVDEDD